MGNYKPPDGRGDKSSTNGYDSIYNSHTYRDYVINKRPYQFKAKGFVVFLSIDIIGLFIILGFIKTLSDAKEIIALIVAMWWIGARAIIITVKILSFYGKNSESIRKGIKAIRDLFKE